MSSVWLCVGFRGFLVSGGGFGVTPQLQERDAEVVQRLGEVGAVAARVGGNQLPTDRDGFLIGCQA